MMDAGFGMTPPKAREVVQKEKEEVWTVVHRP
jgi:hypothetical protein